MHYDDDPKDRVIIKSRETHTNTTRNTGFGGAFAATILIAVIAIIGLIMWINRGPSPVVPIEQPTPILVPTPVPVPMSGPTPVPDAPDPAKAAQDAREAAEKAAANSEVIPPVPVPVIPEVPVPTTKN